MLCNHAWKEEWKAIWPEFPFLVELETTFVNIIEKPHAFVEHLPF